MKPEEKPIIKLIAVDVDGTLINKEMKIPEVNKVAIDQARKNGCHVVICSGRGSASVRQIYDTLNIQDIVPSIGGCVLTEWDGTVINDYRIDKETAEKLYDIARKYDVYPYVFTGNDWLSDPENAYWNERERVLTNVAGVITDIREYLKTNSPNKMLFPKLNEEDLKNARDEINTVFSDKIVSYLSQPYYLEVLPKGINKGTAINDLVKYFNIGFDNVLAIGDYYNDVDMFKAAGNTATVDNAPDDIKAMVDYVSPLDCSSGAVAEIIRAYGII